MPPVADCPSPEEPHIEIPSGWDASRPYIYVNMAMTMDGKITTEARDSIVLGSEADWERMDQLRAQADGIINGANTIRADNPPVRVKSPRRKDLRTAAGKAVQPWNIVVTNGGGVPRDARILKEEGARVLILHPERARAALEDVLALDNVEGVVAGESQVDLVDGLAQLPARGVGLLLAEGGASFNGSLIDADVVDEFFLTVTPAILSGTDAPSPVEGPGLSPETGRRFALVSCATADDQVFLRYQRKRS